MGRRREQRELEARYQACVGEFREAMIAVNREVERTRDPALTRAWNLLVDHRLAREILRGS